MRPVGWWVKAADGALDGAFDAALEGTGVDRRRWQLLASLAGGPVGEAGLLAPLAHFDPPGALASALADLRDRGWVEESGGHLRLTADGVAQHGALAPRVAAVRGRVSAALPPEDYSTLVTLLERLVEGLRRTP